MQNLKTAKYIVAAMYFVFALLYFNSLLHYIGNYFSIGNRAIGAMLFLIYFLAMAIGIMFSKKLFAILSCFNFAIMLFFTTLGLFSDCNIFIVIIFSVFLIGLILSIKLL